jgi:Uma2 family endonuclease
VSGIPDMIIEILSPSNPEHDRNTKFELYEQAGISEYWLVDPEARTIEGFVLGEQGSYALLGHFGAEEAAVSRVLEGFSVVVDEVIPQK